MTSDSTIGPKGAPGWRAYAIGDVHGRLDLLDQALALIEQDARSRGDRKLLLVSLGDLIDRGPDSQGVIERLRTYSGPARVETVLGNHEEVLLRLLAGEKGILDDWLMFGGAQCLQSYGVDPRPLRHLPEADALKAVRDAIPQAHRSFLEAMADSLRFGDYLFVHAGIRPGVPLDEQKQSDLRWIRRDFLDHGGDHGMTVVHGHTISEFVEVRSNRIGLDTGAYYSGRLSVIAIEDERRWFLSTLD